MFLGVVILCAVAAHAADSITIRKPGDGVKSSLDLGGMRVSGPAGGLFLQTLENDLRRSGWFVVTRTGSGGILVQGTANDSGGSLSVLCEARAAGTSRMRKNYRENSASARRLAHQVADDLVMALKGVRGIASTRIAMIGSRGGRKDLYICDADGGSVVQVTRDGVPCLSPSWSPTGTFLTYTSYRKGFPDVYRIELKEMRRSAIARFPGLNSSAAISPAGNTMALSLSKDGNPDLYVMSAQGGTPTRITRTAHAVESSPSWAPDGSRLAFVSDRSRSPQLYIMSAGGQNERRMTMQGNENVSPDWGPNGKIVYSSRRGGVYQLCILDPATGVSEQITTDGSDHEDPSWAPNGRHIVYTRTSSYRKSLYVLDTLGDPEVRLSPTDGDWSSPAWSRQ
jgi:TolB protein